MKRPHNFFFWFGFGLFVAMLIMYFLVRGYEMSRGDTYDMFTYDPIFYVLPGVFMLGGLIGYRSKRM